MKVSDPEAEKIAGHEESVVASFSGVASYQRKIAEAGGGFWMDRYPDYQYLYARLMHDRNDCVQRMASGGERLLDCGCGLGDMLYTLADRYSELCGIDPTEGFCERARDNLSKRVTNIVAIDIGVCESLPYPDNHFDTALMLDVYEHIDKRWRPAALAEVFRVLRPGGELFVATPSRHVLRFWNVFDNLLMMPKNRSQGKSGNLWRFVEKAHTEVFVSKSQLQKGLISAGFEVDHFERIGFYPAPERPGWFEAVARRADGSPRRQKILSSIFSGFRSLRVFNQKMFIRAVRPKRL